MPDRFRVLAPRRGIPSHTLLVLPSGGTQNLEGQLLDSLCPEWHGQLRPPSGVLRISVWGAGGARRPVTWGLGSEAHTQYSPAGAAGRRAAGLWPGMVPARAPIYAEDGTRLASGPRSPLRPAERRRERHSVPCSCPGRLALRLRGCSGAEVILALVGCLPVAAPLSLSFPPSQPPRPLLSLLLSAFPTGLPSVSLEVVPKPACYSRRHSLLVVGVPEPGCERGLGLCLLRTQPPPSHPAAQSWAGAPPGSQNHGGRAQGGEPPPLRAARSLTHFPRGTEVRGVWHAGHRCQIPVCLCSLSGERSYDRVTGLGTGRGQDGLAPTSPGGLGPEQKAPVSILCFRLCPIIQKRGQRSTGTEQTKTSHVACMSEQ